MSKEIPGFVWAYRFTPGNQPTALGVLDRAEFEASASMRWLHLGLSDARVPGFLASIPGLSEAALQTLTGRDGQTLIDYDDGILHGVLVDFQRSFDEDTHEFGWLRFAITDNLIITTRLKPLGSVDRAKTVIEQSRRIKHPSDVLESIVAVFQRGLVAMVNDLTNELNQVEDYVFDDQPRDERKRLGQARRIVVRLHRHLRAVLAAFRRLETADEDDVPELYRDMSERLADRIERVDRDVFSLQERARLLHEEIDSKVSSETNRHLYVLSIMTAFLLPPTLVAGVFGMNTGGLPWLDSPDGTIYALILCGISIFVAWALLRRTGIF